MGSGSSHPRTALRLGVAWMLGVWILAQTLCTAHCHGILPSGRTGTGVSPHQLLTVANPSKAGPSKAGSTCCSRTRPVESGPDQGSHGETPGSARCNGHPAVPMADPGTDPTPSAPSRPDPMTCLGGERAAWAALCGLPVDPWSLRAGTSSSPPGFDPALFPRWDAGYEPSETLGTGLRSLAPPARA